MATRQESTGKSTLLERLTGLPIFPRNADLCVLAMGSRKILVVELGYRQSPLEIKFSRKFSLEFLLEESVEEGSVIWG